MTAGDTLAADAFDQYVDRLIENEVAARRSNEPEPPTPRRPVRTTGFVNSAFNGLTTSEALAASIGADLKGAEAGVVIAPFAFRGGWLSGFNLALGSLEGSVIRLGAGYSRLIRREALTLAELDLSCIPDEEITRRAVEQVRLAGRNICASLPPKPLAPGVDESFEDARTQLTKACAPDPTTARTVMWFKAQLLGPILRYQDAVDEELKAMTPGNEPRPPRLQQSMAWLALVQEAGDTLKKLDSNQLYKCPTHDEISEAASRELGVAPAVTFRADFFPIRAGFVPECEKDPTIHGCLPGAHPLKRLEGVLAFAFQRGRFNVNLACGLASDREKRNERPELVVSPKLELSGQLVEKEEGKTPGVGIGIELELDIAPNHEATQLEAINALKLVAHVDVEVTEKLSFRLGIPLEGKQAKLEADEMAMTKERSALQWTVPVSIATVLKLE